MVFPRSHPVKITSKKLRERLFCMSPLLVRIDGLDGKWIGILDLWLIENVFSCQAKK